ncbi:MAG: glycosyltransferase family 39 protein [Anaerolineaceae bacterium]|nr:glycosyltransferase family 39 protein [Anaerolineaceae bacterium]
MTLAKSENKKNWMRGKNRIWNYFFLLALIVGISVRLYDIDDPPLDFHPTRQLHSAIIARGMYYQLLMDAPEWKRQLSFKQWRAEGLIEPQIMERLTAFSYRVFNNEHLWFARIWSISFWVCGGIFVFLVTNKLSGPAGAAVAGIYFFVWPYTAIASRSFQPESLMVMMIAVGLWAVINWLEKQNYLWAVVAGITCGMAIYIKSVAVFFIAPTLAGVLLENFKFKNLLRSRQVWTIFLLSIMPYIGYHIWGVYGLGLLSSQFKFRFFPALWTTPAFYLQWLHELERVIGFEIIFISIIGIALFSPKKYRGLFIGFFIGYVLYGFTFPYHISTHDYYHLPFVIFAALGLGFIFNQIVKDSEKTEKKYSRVIFSLALIFFIILNAWDIRVVLKRENFRNEIVFWERLGKEYAAGQKVIGILPDYGYRLAYWGWMDVTPWLGSDDIKLRELAGQKEAPITNYYGKVSGYDLFMVTQMNEFDRQTALKDFLWANYEIIRNDGEIIIFDLNDPLEK